MNGTMIAWQPLFRPLRDNRRHSRQPAGPGPTAGDRGAAARRRGQRPHRL